MSSLPEIDDALSEFFEDSLITKVIRVVKSGKEGTVYCCEASPRTGHELLAAKVYRSREHRMFHNNAVYEEGRWVGDRRIRRAMANKSRVGRVVQADNWVTHEFETLKFLHGVGAIVPEPISRNGQTILMGYVGDRDRAAPLLQHAEMTNREAESVFRELLGQIELWLSFGWIHADLSPFNILFWDGRPTVIDFPQAVTPESNGNARALLTRDLTNICRFFARFGIDADPDRIAFDLWRRYRTVNW